MHKATPTLKFKKVGLQVMVHSALATLSVCDQNSTVQCGFIVSKQNISLAFRKLKKRRKKTRKTNRTPVLQTRYKMSQHK